MSFSESAALPIRDIVEWADEEARWAASHAQMAELHPSMEQKAVYREKAAKHQARARWLYETLAAATVDREKT